MASCEAEELLKDGSAFAVYSACGFPDDGREVAHGSNKVLVVLLMLALGVLFAGLFLVEIVLVEGARDGDVDGKSLATAPHWEKHVSRTAA
jgi:hypothetical protein